MLKFYSFDRSPFAWKTRIVLAEKNVPHETIIPENKNEDPEFAKLNPFRLTPVLELEDGRTIFESTVIDEYLEEKYPTPAMLPKDPYDRARVRMLEDTTDLYLYKAIGDFRNAQFKYEPPYFTRKPKGEIDMNAAEEARKKIHSHLAWLDRMLGEKGPWFGGELFSLADATLVAPLTGSLKLFDFLPSDKYRNLSAWCERAGKRPSCVTAAPKQPMTIRES